MTVNAEAKTQYAKDVIMPKLEEAFQRGEKKYVGSQHSHCPRIQERSPEDDIRHVRDCHCHVRLAEAEDEADGGNLEASLSKIESAMGYLAILHMRVKEKLEG